MNTTIDRRGYSGYQQEDSTCGDNSQHHWRVTRGWVGMGVRQGERLRLRCSKTTFKHDVSIITDLSRTDIEHTLRNPIGCDPCVFYCMSRSDISDKGTGSGSSSSRSGSGAARSSQGSDMRWRGH